MTALCPNCAAPNATGARFCRSCGKSLTKRRWWQLVRPTGRTRRVIVGVVVAVLVITVGGLFLAQRTYDPRDPVRDFIAALLAKDTTRLAEITGCGTLCQDGALATGYTPPSELEVGDVTYGIGRPDDVTRRPNANIAAVAVRYVVAGTTYDDAVTVTRGNRDFLRAWSLGDPPGGWLDVVSAQLSRARIAGATVTTVRADQAAGIDGAVRMFPGQYTVGTPGNALLTAPEVTVVVGAGGHQVVTLEPQVRREAGAEVDRLIRARIDDCASQQSLQPTSAAERILGCPFQAALVTTERNVRWTILAYPQVELQPVERPLGADRTFAVQTLQKGRARVNYEYTLDVLARTWSPAEETVEFGVRGAAGTDDSGAIVWCNSCEY